jgi:NAD(P)-dependent dehydrogenase (short-subunit alcohol dehydrogenase family)
MTGRLRGKTALITGASRGIGRAIAETYSAEGASLVLTATTLESLESVAKNLPDAVILAADLSDSRQVHQLFEDATSQRTIDILINNAGIYQGKPFEQYTLQELDHLMKVNVYSVFQLTQFAVTHMKKNSSGKVINIASTAGKWESPNQAAYNTTKHAIVGMSKCVALETAPFGVQVNTICPGMVNTDMFQDFDVHAKALGVSLDELKATAASRIPQGRFLEPTEVAHIAVYLGSAESDGMTGQTITISGGMRMA